MVICYWNNGVGRERREGGREEEAEGGEGGEGGKEREGRE